MKRILLILTLAFFSTQLSAQTSDCFENSTGLYWPVKVGLKRNFKSGNKKYTSTFKGDSLEHNGKYYLAETKEYSNGDIKTSYWREENGAVYNFNKEKGEESMEFPSNPEVGFTWKSTDKTWTYRIINLNSSFSTPYCEFTELIEIETESTERKGSVYNLYYMKGKGMIGLNYNGKPYTYIMPDRKLNERNFMSFGCENAGSEKEIEKCTYAKIFQHIQANYKSPAKVKKGKILVNVVVGKDGKVVDATIAKGLPKASKQEAEAIRVLKTLPTFIPAQVDDNQPIKASFTVPITF